MGTRVNESRGKRNNFKNKKGPSKVKIYRKKKSHEEPETDIIHRLRSQYQNIVSSNIKNFHDFPLSKKTLNGLEDNNYKSPTEIQRESIGLSLQGRDILGAAITGSGKTLAFLIPVLELLYCEQWTRLDGLGALIITPTRELAYQIFETLRKIGIHHDFSAGLIIGGKDLKFERKRMDQCNIVICTPGRLLQHMDENPLFDAATLKILVLDEADRCLDLGFERTMNAIIENLPKDRQTLLFSATQTKSIRDLARLSLTDPMFVSVHEHAKFSTPSGLQQSYIVCELHEKISVIWSFIRNHLKHKSIIFLSSCKQVKYIYEIFCKLRPGVSLLALYGTLHQMRRMEIYESFCRKSNAVLFATDIAARGLDFPEVNWVVQVDCPEDANTYIHRAGRTARYEKGGESLLLLLPSEEAAMLKLLEEKKIPINQIKINPTKLHNPDKKIQPFLAQNKLLKESAQRAFVSYIKSIFLMKNKEVFDVNALDTDAYAHSLGLEIPPRIRFLQKYNKQKQKNTANNNDFGSLEMKSSDEESNSEIDEAKSSESENKNQKKSKNEFFENEGDDDLDIGDVFKIKRKNVQDEIILDKHEEEAMTISKNKKKPLSKAKLAKKLLNKKVSINTKITFDEEGEMIKNENATLKSEAAQEYEQSAEGGIDIEKAKLVLREEDKHDKQRFREKIKEKHRMEKQKLKKARKEEEQEEQDDFGSDSGGESPDTSWIPDPDKKYEPKSDQSESSGDENRGSDDESNAEHSEQSDESEDEVQDAIHRPKRKLITKKQQNTPNKRFKNSTLTEISADFSVNEAEELALQLLGQ